jgi:hypothetical protein
LLVRPEDEPRTAAYEIVHKLDDTATTATDEVTRFWERRAAWVAAKDRTTGKRRANDDEQDEDRPSEWANPCEAATSTADGGSVWVVLFYHFPKQPIVGLAAALLATEPLSGLISDGDSGIRIPLAVTHVQT